MVTTIVPQDWVSSIIDDVDPMIRDRLSLTEALVIEGNVISFCSKAYNYEDWSQEVIDYEAREKKERILRDAEAAEARIPTLEQEYQKASRRRLFRRHDWDAEFEVLERLNDTRALAPRLRAEAEEISEVKVVKMQNRKSIKLTTQLTIDFESGGSQPNLEKHCFEMPVDLFQSQTRYINVKLLNTILAPTDTRVVDRVVQDTCKVLVNKRQTSLTAKANFSQPWVTLYLQNVTLEEMLLSS